MDDPHKSSSNTSELKTVLPDVVHSQQISAVGNVVTGPVTATGIVENKEEPSVSQDVDESKTESISEHIPSKLEYSTESDNGTNTQGPLRAEPDHEKVSKSSSLNIPIAQSSASDHPSSNNHSKGSSSCPLDVNAISDIQLLSVESPNPALSDLSKETQEKSEASETEESQHDSPQGTPRNDEYLDSLNDESSHKSNLSEDVSEVSDKTRTPEKVSSGSEEIIKLDIRGQGAPKFPFPTAKIIFGPPPEGGTLVDSNVEPIPVFPNLLSPFLVGAGDSVKVEEVLDDHEQSKDPSDKSLPMSPDKQSLASDKIENDLLVEEITVEDDLKEKESDKQEETSIPKSPPDEMMSYSTLTTEYKTLCEECHMKHVHLEEAITQRDELIQELTVSLQRSVCERDDLKYENDHLTNEVQNLQHYVAERSSSEHDTIKGQISDFMKYQSLIKDDTKFFSALMSGGSSMHSSNGEKDMDREEIVINHSRSDLKSSEASDEFQTGLENKVTTIIDKFDEYIEENLRNKLRESIIQVLCDEISKMRLDFDTEIKELETHIQQDKTAFNVETRKLRELLSSVKAGSADIEALRQELDVKHEKEMQNLRTYFEKKCSDIERSYSEEVWRGKACMSPCGSASSLDAPTDAAGDCLRRRTRSAELPSLSLEPAQVDQALKQACKKYEQQIEELRMEHLAYVTELQVRQREALAALEEQISQLKAHIQTNENTEANVSLYQQDIDLELEKTAAARLEARLEEVRDQVRQEVVNHFQEQLQVLLSDPDAEVSSWPLELVALREKIHGDAPKQEKECSSLRDELSLGEDKWKQRRNISFDQNRQLEEVTKERDDLKRVAAGLHRAVGDLVRYCASAEDELNRTVLAQLLARLLPPDASDISEAEEESRPSTPNLSGDLNTSVVSRTGRHVHFAPDLNAILSDLDEEGIAKFLAQQRDVSGEIKRSLESSLRRLQLEARALLQLSARLADKSRNESKMLESSEVKITELVEELDAERSCDCTVHRKNMEEAMSECLQRENLLRSDLEAAMIKIAQLMTSADVIAEGYGTGPQVGSLGPRARPPATPGSASHSHSLDSPRALTLAHDIDALTKERDDLHQQVRRMTASPAHKICCDKLEAANRQLRSTRQFVEEQASEREAERDEFARRLADLRDENTRLGTRLQNNARILNEMHCLRLARCNCREHDAHVEQLEAQTREMNQIITELEARKASTDDQLKASEEKITLLRDIIANLESQLEQKTNHETEILQELEQMKNTIEERDGKMRMVIGELESLKSEKAEQSDVICVKCGQDEDKHGEFMEKVKEQCRYLEDLVHRRTRKLERMHEVCSTSCSEPSEDVSLRDQRQRVEVRSPESEVTPRADNLSELCGVWECLQAHSRAEDAVLKRVHDLEMQRAQLKDVAQEVRAERDVLQARMSEQALKISSLSARLQRQRNDAEALSHHHTAQLSVQLHDATAEVQRLKEELDSKDKQLVRLKQTQDERDKLQDERPSLYGNSCNPKDKVIILERELSAAQSRIAQLENLARSLEQDKEELHSTIRDCQRALAEKEDQLQELLALKLDEDNQREERSDVLEGKASARTLSDIVSISEFDEQDLQMRRAELKAQNANLSGAPYIDIKERTLNRTVPGDLEKPNMSSLNIEYEDHFDVGYTPRADSLPAHLTSTQNRDILKQYKRNVNETTMFGIENVKHSPAQIIPDNCSMYPNRDVSATKDLTVEPKKINFSLETSDNKTSEEFTSLRELGITLDIKQENFPDILSQLKHEIKKSRSELETCKSELKNAEEQLCEFPALKEEVEELKGLLENTMATMETDKKFYENQLENFSSNKNLLEQRLTELSQEVNDKTKDLHLLKEDILRRENMILELAKEKRNLTNKMTELEVKIDELQSRNNALEKYETENIQMREKINQLQKLEQLVSEKNQQIDSLNQHLDRLDDLQRCLNDKSEELDNLKEAFEEKSNEVFQMQDTLETLNRDMTKLNDDNDKLISNNNELKLKLTKLEKEQENASLKLQNSESELDRVNLINNELTLKIEELKLLTDKLKDKETEIEILHEDINAFHEEIASLKEQLKMVSRSPSPRSKAGDERKSLDRVATNDKRQLVKIRKQISLLQHELDFNKKELNDKAFELAKAKLDVTELRNNLSQAAKQVSDRDAENSELKSHTDGLQREIQDLRTSKQQLGEQLELVIARLREESNVSEVRSKLRLKAERCQQLEAELENMRQLVERVGISGTVSAPVSLSERRALAVRSPTAELERALRDQLDYSHTLDEDIMEQILSASSDEREDIPRLALNTSKSSSSIHSSSSERVSRLRADNDRLQMQVSNLEARLQDKDALINELNRVRDKLVQDWQTSKLRYEAERDNSGRLQLLLDTHKETAESMQNQDSNMIQILKKRLESAMKSELELQQREQQLKSRLARLERAPCAAERPPAAQLQHEMENNDRLKGEISLLKSKLEVERTRYTDLQAMLEHSRQQAQRDIDARSEQCAALRTELAEMKRLKHESSVQLVRAQELIRTQSASISSLDAKLAASATPRETITHALTEIESTKSELAREIATLRKCVVEAAPPELHALRSERALLAARVDKLERAAQLPCTQPDDKDHAIRYLHGRCLRLESCRKALVWQKRYLQRVLAGYTELERNLRLPSSRAADISSGKKRFKCVALLVAATLRMRFLVQRRLQCRALAAHAVLRAGEPLGAQHGATPGSQYTGTSPPSREPAPAPAPAPASPAATTYRAPASLARRVLKQEMRLNLPASPGVPGGEFVRRSPFAQNSPQDPFILSSPRGEMGAAYLNKLELVSRCLSRAMESARDVP